MLRLILAESLYAQNRQYEAEVICSEVRSHSKLLKMEKLRLSIIFAKLAHVNARYEEALRYWTDAMTSIQRYNLANGHTTRIIILSISHVLRQEGDFETEAKSWDQLRMLERLARPTGVFYWIGGLRHWLTYLESINNRSRM